MLLSSGLSLRINKLLKMKRLDLMSATAKMLKAPISRMAWTVALFRDS